MKKILTYTNCLIAYCIDNQDLKIKKILINYEDVN